ncbi:TSUP family transporter [Colwellia asteriadis]|uniref:Probable membrane transporter protein n=1 Tax=Colwellia asteriadis TaxID=517723 RepID=A0ABN1L729_9GAMM
MELINLSFEILAFLFVIAIVAGFLDTLAGGGGLLTLPALMMSGMPPLAALATNKLQSTAGVATATVMMLRNKRVRWRDVKYLMLAAFIGSALGTLIVQIMNTEALTIVIPIVIAAIGIYFLVTPVIDDNTKKPRVSPNVYKYVVTPTIGCYDGLFGPGTGSFFALAGRSLRAQPFLQATAVAKTLNFSTNLASLIVFIFAGHVVWLVGIIMMAGQFIGAWLGSHCLFKIPVKYLRYLVVVMCFAMLAKYLTS